MLQGHADSPVTAGWRSTEVRDALDLCLACKGCKKDCPVEVDMATMKAEFLAHHYAGRLRPAGALLDGLAARRGPARWRLRRMDRWISQSDPHLAAMLAIFARLTADEAIASIEQARFRRTRLWGNLVRMGQALWLLITYARRAIGWTAKAVTRPWSGGERSWLGHGTSQVRSHADERFS